MNDAEEREPHLVPDVSIGRSVIRPLSKGYLLERVRSLGGLFRGRGYQLFYVSRIGRRKAEGKARLGRSLCTVLSMETRRWTGLVQI